MPRKWKDEEYQYQQEYIKDNIKFVSVPFNLRKKDDGELYDHLNRVEEKKATYIKRLIRDDMEGKANGKRHSNNNN